jgi:DNA-binding transcriptional MerR regulator
MKDYPPSEVSQISGATPRAVQFWADAGVLKAEPGTQRKGRGVHRRFSRDEVVVACVVRPFAAQGMTVRHLLLVANAMRQFLKTQDRKKLEAAIQGEKQIYLRLTTKPEPDGKIMAEAQIVDEGLFEKAVEIWTTGRDMSEELKVLLRTLPPETRRSLALGWSTAANLDEQDSFSSTILLNNYVKGMR